MREPRESLEGHKISIDCCVDEPAHESIPRGNVSWKGLKEVGDVDPSCLSD